jgi:DNA-binding LytR/AlgR family response regulator
MKIAIIEDEAPAAQRLQKMLVQLNNDIEVVAMLDSVETTVQYFVQNTHPDLAFMDIQLGDGLSFDIFEQTTIKSPVIFTTAFDQYTLRAFKVNSIDYLLKPIDELELETAVKKYREIYSSTATGQPIAEKMMRMMEQFNSTAQYKERLLIKRGQQFSYLKTSDTAYCYADGKLCYAVDLNGNRFLLETNLTLLETQMNPAHFYRINRHLLVHIESVKKVHTWLGSRLKVELHPASTADTVVSRERVNGFKEWLDR